MTKFDEKPNSPVASGPGEFVTEAYGLSDQESMVGFYDKWANEYDEQMEQALQYCSPRLIAQQLQDFLDDKHAKILDIGCGTGLASKYLHEAGFDRLFGLDLSPTMIEVARTRGFYSGLEVADVNLPLSYPSESFGGAISSGTFTHGHVGPEPLDEIIRLLEPGGVLACTVHMDLWEEKGFKRKFEELQTNDVITLLSLSVDKYYDNTEPEGWFCVYQKNH